MHINILNRGSSIEAEEVSSKINLRCTRFPVLYSSATSDQVLGCLLAGDTGVVINGSDHYLIEKIDKRTPWVFIVLLKQSTEDAYSRSKVICGYDPTYSILRYYHSNTEGVSTSVVLSILSLISESGIDHQNEIIIESILPTIEKRKHGR